MTKNVIAAVRGAGAANLALAGHFDVVETANYRDFEYLAF